MSDVTDHNLLFGVIALQCDLIDRRHFIDACTLWAARKRIALADLLVEQGWLSQADRQYVDALLERRQQRETSTDGTSTDGTSTDGTSTDETSAESGWLSQSLDDDISVVHTIAATMGEAGLVVPSSDGLSGESPGPRLPGSRLPGSRLPGSRLPGSRLPGSRLIEENGTFITDAGNIAMHERVTLRGLHSSGGIGEVWRAYDEVLEREIALKRLRLDKSHSEAHRARFFREAKLTGQLDHPGIVPVYDYGTNRDGSHRYYTMRFLRGRTLTDVVAHYHEERASKHQTVATGEFLELLRYFLSICDTMSFAHSRNVIHRDLKGDNIIIGDFGEVIVLDWGLAKQLDVDLEPQGERADSEVFTIADNAPASQTLQGEQLGTPSHMAPEQARGRIDLIDHRTDVYGLAAILYEILVGRPPFTGKNVVEIMQRVMDEPPPPPSQLVPECPPELERVCLQGLSKDMSARPESAKALARHVRDWLIARSERKRTEEERERFFDLSLDLLAILQRPDRLSQTNSAWQSMLGHPADALRERSLLALVAPEDRAVAVARLERVWAGEPHVDFEVRLPCANSDGFRWIHWNAKKIPRESAIYLVGRDVTERKRAEKEFQGLLESAPDAMCVIDETGTIVLVNAQLEGLLGYPREELLGREVELLVPEQYRGRHRHHVSRFIAQPAARPMGIGLELLGQKSDGTIFPLEISLSPVQTETRMLVSCTLRDTSERKRRERKLQAILDAAPDAMLVVDAQGTLELVNKEAERLFGYARSELIGQPVHALIPERAHDVHARHVAGYVAAPSARPMGRETTGEEMTLHGRHKDGTEFPVHISLGPVHTEDGLLVCSTIRPAS